MVYVDFVEFRFENYLAKKWTSEKRFGLEGAEVNEVFLFKFGNVLIIIMIGSDKSITILGQNKSLLVESRPDLACWLSENLISVSGHLMLLHDHHFMCTF